MAVAPFVTTLSKIAKTNISGPRPTFTEAHVARALLLIAEEGPIGRAMLAQRVGLGEGASRTLLRRLMSHNLVIVKREGATLTAKGRKLNASVTYYLTSPVDIEAGKLSLHKFSSAILVRGAAHVVRLGIEQRDAAVREGATGASTLIFKNGAFLMPGESRDCESSYPDKVWGTLRKIFSPREGDVIIVASAPTRQHAEIGCLASALATLSDPQQAPHP